VPFHLLTKEFYTLVKQHLAPGGAAAFNVHDGTKLYASTLLTLRAVFPRHASLSLRRGEVIVVVTGERRRRPMSCEARSKGCRRNSASASRSRLLLARRADKERSTQVGRNAHRRLRAGEPLTTPSATRSGRSKCARRPAPSAVITREGG
jgi:hypothetical protein